MGSRVNPDAVQEAVLAGKISPSHYQAWMAMWRTDPMATQYAIDALGEFSAVPAEQRQPVGRCFRLPSNGDTSCTCVGYCRRSAETAAGALPDWNLPCRFCGEGVHWVDVHAAEVAEPVSRRCGHCGTGQAVTVVFTRWVGAPVHMVDPRWSRGNACTITDGPEALAVVVSDPIPTITVWCGPPADRPIQPSPEDLLRACGIDPDLVFGPPAPECDCPRRIDGSPPTLHKCRRCGWQGSSEYVHGACAGCAYQAETSRG